MSTEKQNVLEFIDPSEEDRKRKLKHLFEMWQAAEELGAEYIEEDELSGARRELQKEVMDILGYERHTLEIKMLKEDFYEHLKIIDNFPNNFRLEADGSMIISFEGGIQFNDWSRERQKGLLICLDWNEGAKLVFDDLKDRPRTIAEIPRESIIDMRWKRRTNLDVNNLEEETGVTVNEEVFLNVCDIAIEQEADVVVTDYSGKKWILIKVSTKKASWEIVMQELFGNKRRETFSWLDFEAREPKVRLDRKSEKGV